jgi:prepilin-type N-terminal cleavage/methylation domain-containing protein
MSCPLHAAPNARRGFTLVELMVVLVILSILGSLMLAGLNVARTRSRSSKTYGTLSKLSGVVSAHFDSYADRSVPVAGTTPAQVATSRLVNRRTLQVYEMPDSWADVMNGIVAVTGTGSTVPSFARTGTVRGYAAYKNAVAPTAANQSAECLYMIVARSGFDPYAIEQFRNDEIGDTDNDGAMEFLDHRGRPLIFLRWAPGFSPYSDVQVANPTTNHDPMDPQRVDAAGYTLIPLIVSGGDDELTGLQVATAGWLPLSLLSIVTSGSNVGAPDDSNPPAYRDNLTNHDVR